MDLQSDQELEPQTETNCPQRPKILELDLTNCPQRPKTWIPTEDLTNLKELNPNKISLLPEDRKDVTEWSFCISGPF